MPLVIKVSHFIIHLTDSFKICWFIQERNKSFFAGGRRN